jgi:hypothetical protein
MKRLVALKEKFDKGQMGEREFLHERNVLISTSTGIVFLGPGSSLFFSLFLL